MTYPQIVDLAVRFRQHCDNFSQQQEHFPLVHLYVGALARDSICRLTERHSSSATLAAVQVPSGVGHDCRDLGAGSRPPCTHVGCLQDLHPADLKRILREIIRASDTPASRKKRVEQQATHSPLASSLWSNGQAWAAFASLGEGRIGKSTSSVSAPH